MKKTSASNNKNQQNQQKQSKQSTSVSIEDALKIAHAARDASRWQDAINLYRRIEQVLPQSAEIKHNLALCLLGEGALSEALLASTLALQLKPSLWQSRVIMAKTYQEGGQMSQAHTAFEQVLAIDANNAQARLGLAHLALNIFGNPLAAREWVKPLERDPQFGMDAQLTILMSSLYERPNWNAPATANSLSNAQRLSNVAMEFSRGYLRLPNLNLAALSDHSTLYAKKGFRPRVALLSPFFNVSPVAFLCMAGIKHLAKGCDLVFFSRSHQRDWASDQFEGLAAKWVNAQNWTAPQLASAIHAEDIDVLYDLGGWSDPVGLKAISAQPARKIFKWIGGQSMTTGLTNLAGWIGDQYQSPVDLQSLYSEPLINIAGGYCTYTPPPYLPKPARKKSKEPCIFANPAKVSNAFLEAIKKIKGPKVFIHRQYQYTATQERVQRALGKDAVFVIPTSHAEALAEVNRHAVMLDTFPYSSGLTAYEAQAMGTEVKSLATGSLFCERHTVGRAKK